ncbi:MAG: response regulator [Rhodospirillaceae bacterium]|jgi:DNA-binding response OmpR family regulator|nr:response regulator [Rhodospirillaceae bacterium]MBT5298567.1 response regulator [Rhodospirillaceae bacterium]MBT6084275.1 response regulator [Rhodospirillaceae bacterium]MBT6606970.1 response regulator [Rhodospirillaceae bacterium]MBT7510999.1 response regulator [Rhodospirillaceae bacterium]
MRLLLVEDHERFAEFVRLSVEKEGFTVDAVHNAEDAEAAFSAVSYDVILLDLGLPDSDGLELLKSWRDRGDETPVLIVTARDGVDDRVVGLNLGGDDYLVKPFAMEELVARIRALLRRPGGALGTVMTAGNITFDSTAREVQIDGFDEEVSSNSVEVHVSRLRKRLAEANADVTIHTLRGVGYLLSEDQASESENSNVSST